jgi:hypothetical protein
MHMGDLCTASFVSKGPSAGNTYITITINSYWVMSGLYIRKIYFFKIN